MNRHIKNSLIDAIIIIILLYVWLCLDSITYIVTGVPS